MIKEYDICYENDVPRLKVIKGYDYNEDMSDVGMVALLFMEFLKVDEAEIEHIYIIGYDSSDCATGICKIADGDLNSANLDNKKIITFMILSGSTQFIIEHNHPGGNSKPSDGDRFANGSLKALAMMFGLHYIGGLVVGIGEYSIVEGEEHIEI